MHDVEIAIEQTAPLLSSALSYDKDDALSYAPGFAQSEVSVDVRVLGRDEWDAACESFEADCLTGSPGTLVCDGWSTRAYCVSHLVGEVSPRWISASLAFVLVDGYWYRAEKHEYYEFSSETTGGLDYPHDYPHDYGASSGQSSVVVGSLVPCPAKITIYGPVTNPTIDIGGNTYRWQISVPEGAYLVSDGTGPRKTISLVGSGYTSDVFDCGMRGSGAGSGSYCFEPVPPGTSEVSWDGSFGFDLELQVRRGGLPWTSS